MIDNYDSFVYTLTDYFVQLGADMRVLRNDDFDVDELIALADEGLLEGIVISPGPKDPAQAGSCVQLVQAFQQRQLKTECTTPLLGVCLGHQVIAQAAGAQVCLGARPMHGKVTTLTHNGTGLFEGLPPCFKVTRYHSLVVSDDELPSQLQVDARAEDGVIMAFHLSDYPAFGVQFHPEAVMTEYGHELLDNFLKLCKEVQ